MAAQVLSRRALRWCWLVMLTILLGGCLSASKYMHKDAKKRKQPVEPEVWYNVDTVALYSRCTGFDTKRGDFLFRVREGLGDWHVATHFEEALVSRLQGRVPFEVIREGDGGSSSQQADKILFVNLTLSFEGGNAKMLLMADWSVFPSLEAAEEIWREAMAASFALRQYPMADVSPFVRNVMQAPGDAYLVSTEKRPRAEWLANDSALAKSELARLIDLAAEKTATAIIAKIASDAVVSEEPEPEEKESQAGGQSNED